MCTVHRAADRDSIALAYMQPVYATHYQAMKSSVNRLWITTFIRSDNWRKAKPSTWYILKNYIYTCVSIRVYKYRIRTMYISLLLLLITCMHQCCPIFLTPRPKIEIVLLAADRTSELQSSDQDLLNIINCMHCGTLWVVTTLNSLSLTRRWNWMFGSHCQTLRHAVPVTSF